MPFYVYMMSNRPNGTLYIGVTNDLSRRAFEHRTGAQSGFTKQYRLRRLVWYETYSILPRQSAVKKR